MKKKKFFSYMLMGLLTVGATGTVTSCKDYDDDINGLQTQITSLNEALAKQKSDLEAEIATLKKDLTAADARLEGLVQTAQQAADKAQGTADEALAKAVANASSIADEIVRAKAAELALQTRLETAEATLVSLQDQIDKLNENKLDKTEFADSIAKIYGRLEAVETGLGGALTSIAELQKGLADEVLAREALAADLAQQKEALNKLQKQLDDTTSDLNTKISNLQNTVEKYNTALNTKIDNLKADLEAKIADVQRTLQAQITALGDRVTTNESDIATLKGNVNDIYTKISQLQNAINVLNVFCTGQLRSLVFIPSAYYYGIEATEVFALNYFKYTDFAKNNWAVASADKKEPVGYEKSERYNNAEGSTAMDVTAHYHMNPGIADEPDAVTILDADKPFVRASEAVITTKSFKKNGEQLDVKLKFKNPSLIKDLSTEDQEGKSFVTVFAAQAHYKTGDKDTTVTSDYAALYKTTITDVVLAKVQDTKLDPTYTGVKNTVTTDFANAHSNLHSTLNDDKQSHLIPSVYDAMSLAAQSQVVYNQTVDLSRLVEVHYTNAKGEHKTFVSSELDDYGLGLVYELTGSFEGSNVTSEAAHAGVNGATFRAQVPQKDGKAYSWEAYNNTNFSDDSLRTSTVGRQPIVRFSLVDKNNDNRVIDYGYIKIKFVDKSAAETVKPNVIVSYTGKDYTYYDDCNPANYVFSTTWNEIEYDIFQLTGLHKKDFDANYENDGKLVVNGYDVVAQFDPATVKTTDATEATELKNYIGEVVDNYDAEGSQTQTFKWTIKGADLEKMLYDKTHQKTSHTPFTIAIKYKSKDTKKYPDVYIVLTSGKINIVHSSGIFLEANGSDKIREMWYKNNGNGNTELGTDEIHVQTLSPEDPRAGVLADKLDKTIADVFYTNTIKLASLSDNTVNKDFTGNKQQFNFVFSANNNGKKFKGYESADNKAGFSVVEWTLGVSEDGKTLLATHKNNTKLTNNQVVATIDGTYTDAAGIKEQKLSYNGPMDGMSEAANSMLNYVAHNKLADDVLKAIVALKVKTNVCEHELALTNNEFNVRFLRPINATTNNEELTDAKDSKQAISLKKLLTFTDWRDYGFADHETYWKFYNIKNIKIVGMTTQAASDTDLKDGNINPYIYTTMTTADKAEPNKFEDKVLQSTVSNNVRFYNVKGSGTGDDEFGHILYENLSNTVHDFSVRIPLAITYEWGTLYTTVDVKINATQSNAKVRR